MQNILEHAESEQLTIEDLADFQIIVLAREHQKELADQLVLPNTEEETQILNREVAERKKLDLNTSIREFNFIREGVEPYILKGHSMREGNKSFSLWELYQDASHEVEIFHERSHVTLLSNAYFELQKRNITPREFSEKANEEFQELLGENTDRYHSLMESSTLSRNCPNWPERKG